MCQAIANLLETDVSRDDQFPGKRYAKPLSICWQVICEGIANLLASDVPSQCQSAGK
jgi:hypothetical protein